MSAEVDAAVAEALRLIEWYEGLKDGWLAETLELARQHPNRPGA